MNVRISSQRQRSFGILHIDNLSRAVSRYRRGSPNVAGSVVVSADASIVSARTTASDQGTVKVGECSHWLQDCALGASVVAFLWSF